MAYRVDILDHNLNYLATIGNLAPLNARSTARIHTGAPNSSSVKHFLEYSHVLSGIGKCNFRVGTKDPLFQAVGDILRPFANHVRVYRNKAIVWQGVIIKAPSRNSYYIDIQAQTYLYLLNRVLIRHDPADGNGSENYWTIKSGTLADAVRTLINNAKTDMGAPLNALTLGQIDNPNFPAGFTDDTGQPLSGPWTFSNSFTLQFDYRTAFYVLQMLGVYANFDFEVTDQMVLNFKSFIGRAQPALVFTYRRNQPLTNNLTTYNAPLDGDKMVNDLFGIAADSDAKIIHAEQSDAASIAANGKIMGVAAFSDIKANNLLNTRLIQELTQMKTAESVLQLIPNERATPFGQYAQGDTVTANIQDGPLISVNAPRRLVMVDVKVQDTGYEDVTLTTNKPRLDQGLG